MKFKLPKTELKGAKLREAATGDFRDINELVRAALSQTLTGREDRYFNIESLSASAAVVKRDGRYFQHGYTLSDENKITLGNVIEVTKDFKPVASTTANLTEAVKNAVSEMGSGKFIEALNDEGTKYRIRVIDAGVSLNNVDYKPAVLRESVPLLKDVRVFVKSDDMHIKGQGKDFRNLIGVITNPVFVEAKGDMKAGIDADFEVLQSAGETPAKLKEAVERGMDGLFGFSIDADGTWAKGKSSPSKLREAAKITKYLSVDLIIAPGAGGRVIKLIEAVQEDTKDTMLKAKMIEAIKKANKGELPAGLDIENDENVLAAFTEATATEVKPAAVVEDDESGDAPVSTGVSREELTEHTRMTEARADMRVQIANSDLPPAAKDKVLAAFKDKASFKEADVGVAIAAEKDYLAKFTESGKPTGDSDLPNSGYREIEPTNAMKRLDAFFDASDNSVRSFKECYQEITGDKRMSGDIRDASPAKLREAIGDSHGSQFREAIDSGTWGLVLGDSITRAMQAAYTNQNQYDVWRQLADTVPVTDFRTQERTQYGGYGDIPVVAEKAVYTDLDSPTDAVAKYAIAKRGGIENISMEAMRNDDVGSIRRIPTKLSSAAKRTLAKFVLDFMRTNPVINLDNKALFHVDHGNLGAQALTKPGLRTGRLAMLGQQEPDSNDPLGIPPANIWVPHEMEDVGEDLFARKTENDKDFMSRLDLNVIPVWYWTDADDWCLTASLMDIPLIELGFLDGNEEPELFLQDSPTSGSMWTNDTLTYKLRHIYGGNVLDYRGFYKSMVA